MKYTKEQIDNRTSDYVCIDCGVPFLTEKQKSEGGHGTTFHKTVCGLCGKEGSVTHIRHYNRLKYPLPMEAGKKNNIL